MSVELDEKDAFGVDEIVRRLPEFFTISCCSCRQSGKSVLMTQLVRLLIKLKKVDLVVVMSGSAHLNKDWTFIDSRLVMPFSEEKLIRIAKKQAEDKYTWEFNRTPETKRPKHVLIVLDDCLSTPAARESETVGATFTLGRHKMMSCIVISQHTTKFPNPTLRENSDIILFSRLNKKSLENLWYSMNNIEKKDFIAIGEKLAGVDHSFVLLDLFNRASKDPEDCITVVRADDPDAPKSSKTRKTSPKTSPKK